MDLVSRFFPGWSEPNTTQFFFFDKSTKKRKSYNYYYFYILLPWKIFLKDNNNKISNIKKFFYYRKCSRGFLCVGRVCQCVLVYCVTFHWNSSPFLVYCYLSVSFYVRIVFFLSFSRLFLLTIWWTETGLCEWKITLR